MPVPRSSTDASQSDEPTTSSSSLRIISEPKERKLQTRPPQTSQPTMPIPQAYSILSMPAPGSLFDTPQPSDRSPILPSSGDSTTPISESINNQKTPAYNLLSVPTPATMYAAPDEPKPGTQSSDPTPLHPAAMTYPLSRSPLSTARLIAQHALWQHDLGFLVHPAITAKLAPLEPGLTPSSHSSSSESLPTTQQDHTDGPLRIHDLATGTAFWALSLLQSLPPNLRNLATNVTITASDLSLRQAPHPATLPRGMELREWDIYDDSGAPTEWRGTYDVVHLRLALLVIRGGDATPVVQRAWEMLRPGGWMQWDELDVEGAVVVCADAEGCGAEDLTRFQRMQEKASLEELKWVRKLGDTFRQVGFEEVGRQVFEGQRSMAGFLQNLQFLVMQEEVEGRAEGGGKRDERLAEDLEFGLMMSQKGVARVVPKVVVWGRKPLVEPREKMG